MYVMIPVPDASRSHGRTRVRILDKSTNKLVTYPSGRVRWFASEEAAAAWINTRRDVRAFRPRNYSGQP